MGTLFYPCKHRFPIASGHKRIRCCNHNQFSHWRQYWLCQKSFRTGVTQDIQSGISSYHHSVIALGFSKDSERTLYRLCPHEGGLFLTMRSKPGCINIIFPRTRAWEYRFVSLQFLSPWTPTTDFHLRETWCKMSNAAIVLCGFNDEAESIFDGFHCIKRCSTRTRCQVGSIGSGLYWCVVPPRLCYRSWIQDLRVPPSATNMLVSHGKKDVK